MVRKKSAGIACGESFPCIKSGKSGKDVHAQDVRVAQWNPQTLPSYPSKPSLQIHLLWWDRFLASWNGCSMIPLNRAQATNIWTDASGIFGCGALNPTSEQWIQLTWPSTFSDNVLNLGGESMTLKELFPVVLACAIWGPDFRESTVVVHCDSEGAGLQPGAPNHAAPSMLIFHEGIIFSN